MTRDPADHWRRVYAPALDPAATEHQDIHEVAVGTRLATLRRDLRSLYREHQQVDGVLIRVVDGAGTHDVGVATRAKADKDPGHLGTDSTTAVGPGSGDGATLPGFPGEFRPVRYRCREPGCSQTMLRIFYDERKVPSCTAHPSAGVKHQP